jgi:hypothetical protein
MYCDRCGSQITSGAQFCISCGKAVAQGPAATAAPVAPPAQSGDDSRVRRHIHLLATLWLLSGVLRLVAVGSFLLFGHLFLSRGWMGFGAWPWGRGWGFDSFLPGFFSLGIFLGLFGVLHLLLAWGLFERQPWARALGLVLGIFALLRFPLGTALGIYTLWVLAPEHSAREYDSLVRSRGQFGNSGFSPTASR